LEGRASARLGQRRDSIWGAQAACAPQKGLLRPARPPLQVPLAKNPR
jgi:hypothetical protein